MIFLIHAKMSLSLLAIAAFVIMYSLECCEPWQTISFNFEEQFRPENHAPLEHFGRSAALSNSGEFLFVGAPGHDVDGFSKVGGVFVFRKGIDKQWERHQILSAPDHQAGDRLGRALAVSRDGTLFASALYANQRTGRTYSFQKGENSTWFFKDTINPSDAILGEQTGRGLSVSADGQSLVVTSFFSTETGWFSRIYSFRKALYGWNQTSILEFDGFGNALSSAITMDGLEMYVGLVKHNESRGLISRYRRENIDDTWELYDEIKPDKLVPNDHFGNSIAISMDNSVLAITKFNARDNELPSVHFYFKKDLIWMERASIKFTGTEHSSQIASAVALSGSGNSVAIGSHLDDIVTMEEGLVFLYNLTLTGQETTEEIKTTLPSTATSLCWSFLLILQLCFLEI